MRNTDANKRERWQAENWVEEMHHKNEVVRNLFAVVVADIAHRVVPANPFAERDKGLHGGRLVDGHALTELAHQLLVRPVRRAWLRHGLAGPARPLRLDPHQRPVDLLAPKLFMENVLETYGRTGLFKIVY